MPPQHGSANVSICHESHNMKCNELSKVNKVQQFSNLPRQPMAGKSRFLKKISYFFNALYGSFSSGVI